MVKLRKTAISIVSIGLAACFSTSIATMAIADAKQGAGVAQSATNSAISRLDAPIDRHLEDYFDSNVVYRLSDTVKSNQEISVILALNTKSTFDAYLEAGSKGEFADYLNTPSAKSLLKKNQAACDDLIKALDKSHISYEMGVSYNAVISGFEVKLRAKDYYNLANAVGSKAQLIVSERYAPAQTEIVTNDVDVYETGIFNSSGMEHQGEGVIVAVLDTGLDYTHTAFSVDNFKSDPEKDAFQFEDVRDKVANNNLSAATTTANLKAENVYVNRKIPFAYDYADQDTDVFPLYSEHGTHVAGVIAGDDDRITGVAPQAQLAIMKTFSDREADALTSWILAAVDDCVKLGVDVINMSLGTAAGFSTQEDEMRIQVIYDKVQEAGISLICAAGNESVATMNSEKNGNNPLTRNPDAGIVSSPSTYDAALSVASVGGVKTPYMIFNNDIIYFTEATTSSAKTKNFVDDILSTVGGNVTSHDFTYVTIPGVGRRSDYSQDSSYYQGKIVLVKRGDTTFEEKVDIALRVYKAAGIIIYNNVSGTINMSVGASVGAVCSLSQDDGEKLAAAGTGTLRISKDQVAGPFMSDFSSWGPTSDLKIKPEITAHGGEILSAVPGQDYDRMSGTSMAAPNMAGAAALIRQYVKYGNSASGQVFQAADEVEVTKLVNQLAMSTADIIRNKNGLPYAVRKQGAGLVNIHKATTAAAYISTYNADGTEMDKTKLELGDDKGRTGVYTMTFTVHNLSNAIMTYNLDSLIITEGVSTTFTSHGDTTVSQDGYLLNPTTTIVSGGSGNTVTVPANGAQDVTVTITLSEADKAYLNASFENGMYVEGYIRLQAVSGTSIDLNVPLLAFYGDWTEAPIFDEEYYDTNADELNQGIDQQDKLMADVFATRVYGGYYSDFISVLGSYPFIQDPSKTPIAADKDHIALSNYQDGDASSMNSIYSIAGGLLRNVKEWDLTIVEDSTGREIWSMSDYNQRKSSSNGGTEIYGANMDVRFNVSDFNLKNNTKYTVTVTAYIDYGTKEEQNNKRNTFTFPLYIDFEAPIITNVEYRTETDRTTKKTRFFADLSIYDNHYTQAVQFGKVIGQGTDASPYDMVSFGKYITPVYSSFNSTSKVTFELTDYLSQLKDSSSTEYGGRTFVATCYDYAMNYATYELRIPDDVLYMYFEEEEIWLSPNETFDISSILHVYPEDMWAQMVEFTSSDTQSVGVINNVIIAKELGAGSSAVITAKSINGAEAKITVHVYLPGDTGYNRYDPPQASKAQITQYETIFAFSELSNEDRDIGETGKTYDFGSNYSLSMYPGEKIKLLYEIDRYFPETEAPITMEFSTSDEEIVSIDNNGVVVAHLKGDASVDVNATILYNSSGKTKFLPLGSVSITVKDPYTASGSYLMSYKGQGGTVTIPDDRGFTNIQAFAFSNYNIVPKDLTQGDVINEDDPIGVKYVYIGDERPAGERITKIVIPEGVTTIERYAFANLTDLEEVVLPKSLVRIGVGAFYNCQKLTKVNFENVKFISENAFFNCKIAEADFSSVVAIGGYAFFNNTFTALTFPASAQSIDRGAFYTNTELTSVTFEDNTVKIKLGESVFYGCTALKRIAINATIIPAYAFYGCTALTEVTLGRDVSLIEEEAFSKTQAIFRLDNNNTLLEVSEDGQRIYKKNGETEKTLILVGPTYDQDEFIVDSDTIASGAFAGNDAITSVTGDYVKTIESYAFMDCVNLESVYFPLLEEIGDYAFFGCTSLTEIDLSNIKKIGSFAFACNEIGIGMQGVPLTSVTIPSGAVVGDYAFADCTSLTTVVIGDNVTLGVAAFYSPMWDYTYETRGDLLYYNTYTYPVNGEDFTYYRYNFEYGVTSNLTSLTIGQNVTIGDFAFMNSAKLEDVAFNTGVTIGAYAFYNTAKLASVNLAGVTIIGDGAFSGSREFDYGYYSNGSQVYIDYAYEVEVRDDGELYITGYRYTDFVSVFDKADLSSVTELGAGAFALNSHLKEVTFGSALKEIKDSTFESCVALDTIKLSGGGSGIPASVTKIGEYAFMDTKITSIDLSLVDSIGLYAFAAAPITEVTFKDGAIIGDYAFYACEQLATVNNMGGVNTIGAYSFMYTLIETADLTNVVKVGDFAFGQSAVTSVIFGENSKLEGLGENPFYGCPIVTFEREEDEYYHNTKVGTKIVYTYDVNDTVKVINNVLYTVVPNGLQLVCYPLGLTASSYTVEEGTVRIGARAFEGAKIVDVTLPRSLLAIGDKAFYGCEKLTTVIFKSIKAPILEEEYDANYATNAHIPYSGYGGLDISKFLMWNSYPTNFYYGANFVDYIGASEPRLVLVRPKNGTGYDTFIFEKYFKTVVLGSATITDDTISVINLIAAIGEITEQNVKQKEIEVAAIRSAYDALSLDQQALVENYSTLQSAESTIDYINSRLNPSGGGDTNPGGDVGSANGITVAGIVALAIAGVLVLGLAGLVVYLFIDKKKARQTVAAEDNAADEKDSESKDDQEND